MGVARKRYFCPVEVSVDVLGGRWTPVVLAHLKEGVHRYGELRRRMPEVSEKMLIQSLRQLEADGLVSRTVHAVSAEHAASAGSAGSTRRPAPVSYELTDEGRTLAPVLQALYDWGEAYAARHDIPIDPA